MNTYEHDGMTFDVTDAGPADGEVVALLHGYPGSRASWEGVIPALTHAGYRVLAPDQRGYSPGARPKGRRAYQLECLAADVLALGDAAGVETMHIVGHDWGGGVAWALAGWHPERVRTMTSLATPHGKALLRAMVTSGQVLHSWYMGFYQLPRLPELSFRFAAGRRTFRRLLVNSGLSKVHADRYVAAMSEPGAATAAINWYRALPLTKPSRMQAVGVPTMYVYGDADFALGRKAADLTARYVTGPYRYEVLRGMSHWLPEEYPDTVAALVLEHIGAYPVG